MRLTTLDLPGVYRIEEASNKAIERLQRSNTPFRATLTVLDEGVLFQPGDVVQVISTYRGVDFPLWIETSVMVSYGRHQITGITYSDYAFSDIAYCDADLVGKLNNEWLKINTEIYGYACDAFVLDAQIGAYEYWPCTTSFAAQNSSSHNLTNSGGQNTRTDWASGPQLCSLYNSRINSNSSYVRLANNADFRQVTQGSMIALMHPETGGTGTMNYRQFITDTSTYLEAGALLQTSADASIWGKVQATWQGSWAGPDPTPTYQDIPLPSGITKGMPMPVIVTWEMGINHSGGVGRYTDFQIWVGNVKFHDALFEKTNVSWTWHNNNIVYPALNIVEFAHCFFYKQRVSANQIGLIWEAYLRNFQ